MDGVLSQLAPLLMLVVRVWFSGVPASCLVDTGASLTVVSQAFADQLAAAGALARPAGQTTLTVANGQAVTAQVYDVPNVGTTTVGWPRGLVAVVPDGTLVQPCVLGNSFLAQQPLVLSWADQAIYPVAPGTR